MDTPIGRQLDHEQITVSNTAIGLTTSKLAPEVNVAVIQVQDQPIRWNADGSVDPTATLGDLVDPDNEIIIDGKTDLGNFKAIRDGGTDAVLNVRYHAYASND